MLELVAHNFNHFTGKRKKSKSVKRNKKKYIQKKHVNKYEKAR